MAKALIAYATLSGETQRIGQFIVDGIRGSGHEAKLSAVDEIKNKDDLEGYDAYIFGSATYHGDMLQGMKTLLFLGKQAALEGKIGASFGAFGWSGEAPDRIFATMKNVFKMKMVKGPLAVKSSSLGDGSQKAQEYGKMIARLMAPF